MKPSDSILRTHGILTGVAHFSRRPLNAFGYATHCARALLAYLRSFAVAGTGMAVLQVTPVLSGLSTPVYVTNAHDGTQRLFAVEQPGRVSRSTASPRSASRAGTERRGSRLVRLRVTTW